MKQEYPSLCRPCDARGIPYVPGSATAPLPASSSTLGLGLAAAATPAARSSTLGNTIQTIMPMDIGGTVWLFPPVLNYNTVAYASCVLIYGVLRATCVSGPENLMQHAGPPVAEVIKLQHEMGLLCSVCTHNVSV